MASITGRFAEVHPQPEYPKNIARRNVMRKLIFVSMAVVFILPILACGAITPPTNTPIPRPTNTPPFVGGDCDPATERIEMNTSVTKSTSGGSFLDNCNEFCLWVPDSGSSLDIGISDFDIDLDIYVDPNLSVLSEEDSGTSRWESRNAEGADDSVTISNPGGRYYIQVCYYEGGHSSFTLHNQFTP